MHTLVQDLVVHSFFFISYLERINHIVYLNKVLQLQNIFYDFCN